MRKKTKAIEKDVTLLAKAKKRLSLCKKELLFFQDQVNRKESRLEEHNRIVEKHLCAAKKTFGVVDNPLLMFLLSVHPGMSAPSLSQVVMCQLECNDFKNLKATCKLLCLHIDKNCDAYKKKVCYFDNHGFLDVSKEGTSCLIRLKQRK